jgi:inositol oxygenase
MLQTENPAAFRQYIEEPTKDDSLIAQRVYNTYTKMHTYQCVDFVRKQYDRWLKFDHDRLPIYDALEKLNAVVDESDPDVDVPNIYHAFQTAEAIRKSYPDLDWFQLTGLIHDCGKFLALHNEPQWAVVGDTFPVGCQFSDKIVYRKTTFDNNPDLNNEIYSTKYGMYSPNCGLDKCMMSWGHDEYLFRVLSNHKTCTLPQEALYIIRYHSFYPW